MAQAIQDNQYKEAPQGPSYLLGSDPYTSETKAIISVYNRALVDRVLHLDPTIGYGYRPDLVSIDLSGTIASWKETVYTQLPDQLRDLSVLIENHIETHIRK